MAQKAGTFTLFMNLYFILSKKNRGCRKISVGCRVTQKSTILEFYSSYFPKIIFLKFKIGLEVNPMVGRGDFNKIFEKLSDQFALFSIPLIYQYESHKLFCEIFLGR